MNIWQLNHAKGKSFIKLKKLVMIVFLVFLFTACFEKMHLMSRVMAVVQNCFTGAQSKSQYQLFFEQLFNAFFKVWSYTDFWGIFTMGVEVYMLIAWVFLDSWIASMGLFIAYEFQMYNNKLVKFFAKPFTVDDLDRMWTQHQKLCKLVKELDDFLGTAILLCLASSLYNICVSVLLNLK